MINDVYSIKIKLHTATQAQDQTQEPEAIWQQCYPLHCNHDQDHEQRFLSIINEWMIIGSALQRKATTGI